MAKGTPHDSLFRDTFGKPEHAGPLLKALLPLELAAAIDWTSLKNAPTAQVDEQQRNQQSDLLFDVTLHGRPALLYVLFEHTVRPSRWVALQVLAYMVGVWRDLRRQMPRQKHLPPIIPVVVSFGSRRWRATTDLASLFDLRGLPKECAEALRAGLPQFHFTPNDFARKSPSDVRAMGLSLLGMWTVAAQQFVAPVGDDDDLAIRALVEWADVARKVIVAPTGQEAIEALSSYFLKVTKLGQRRLRVIFEQHIGPESVKHFESTYDRITRESKAEGVAEGKAEGKVEGKAEGKVEGKVEGKAEGKVEGRAEGMAEALLRLVRKRFGNQPAEHEARIRNASLAELDRWTDRVLDVASATDLFDA